MGLKGDRGGGGGKKNKGGGGGKKATEGKKGFVRPGTKSFGEYATDALKTPGKVAKVGAQYASMEVGYRGSGVTGGGSGSSGGSSGGNSGGTSSPSSSLENNTSTFSVGGNQSTFTPASARLGGTWDSGVQFEPGPSQWDRGTVDGVTRSGGFGGGGGGATNPTTGGEYSSVSKATAQADVSEVITGLKKGRREKKKRGTE